MPDITEVPLTIMSAPANNYTFGVVIGKNPYYVPSPQDNSYWFGVYDRNTLAQVYSQLQTRDADTVPSDLAGKFNTDQYLLVVATCGLLSAYVPAGKLFSFLVDNGAGVELKRLTQLYQQVGCGSLGTMSYAMAGILGPGLPSHQPVEAAHIQGTVPLYLEATLIGVQVAGKTWYSPSPLTQPKP